MQGASFCIIITAKIEPIVGDENIKYKDMIIEIGKIGHCFLEQSTNNNLGVFQTPAIVDSEASELLGTKVYEEDSFYILAIGKEMKKYG